MMNDGGEQKNIPEPTPPVYPLTPQIPNPQAVFGILQDSGVFTTDNVILPGITLNYSNAKNHFEYITSIEFSNNMQSNQLLANPMASLLRPGAKPHINPLVALAFTCMHYYRIKVHYHFEAIKPPDTSGVFRITWVPASSFPIDNAQQQSASQIFWDVGKRPSLNFSVNIPSVMSFRPTSITSFNLPSNVDDKLSYFSSPYFARFQSSFVVERQTAYQNGALYPPSFTVLVFASIELDGYMLKGPSIGSDKYLNY